MTNNRSDKIESPLRNTNTDSFERIETNSYEKKLQHEADRRVAHANYILTRFTKAPNLHNAAPPAPPNEVDDILEGLDK